MKKYLKLLIIAVLTACAVCTFIFYPFMCTDLHIKIYFNDDSDYTTCSMYYTTTEHPNMSNDTLIHAKMQNGYADLVLSKEFCNKLTGLRLDFSPVDKLICIKRVELCSGGFVQESYDASQFFEQSNITATNDISSLDCVDAVTYIGTSGNDPYIFLHPDLAAECNNAYSHYTKTKVLLCLFIFGTWFLSRKKYFTAD